MRTSVPGLAGSFAAAVNRDDIQKGAELIGLSLDDHIAHCIAALQSVQSDLGLG